MDLPKFLDLLETRQLFFTQLKRMEDAYEGALSSFAIRGLRQQLLDLGETSPDRATKAAEETYQLNQYFAYVSCWHMRSHESMAMWKVYGDNGIAIRTTFARFQDSLLSEPRPVQIGKVKYGNYANTMMNYGNTLAPVFFKRRVFDFEREVRAAHMSLPEDRGPTMKDLLALGPNQPPGVRIEVNMDALIEKVFVSPGKPDWYRTLIEKVLRRYPYNFPLENSTIDKRPQFNQE